MASDAVVASYVGPLAVAFATIAVALIGQWAAFRRYRQRMSKQLRAEAMQSYVTEEQLQADFRKEIREEMRRLREDDERRGVAYRKLEEENSELRRKVVSLEVKLMLMQGVLDMHGVKVAPTTTTTVVVEGGV